jgi:hypothetical protein
MKVFVFTPEEVQEVMDYISECPVPFHKARKAVRIQEIFSKAIIYDKEEAKQDNKS